MTEMVANLVTLAATVTMPEPNVAIKPTMKRFLTCSPRNMGNGIEKTVSGISKSTYSLLGYLSTYSRYQT